MPTAISWTEETWNPTTGCSRVSEGCRFCYAERLSLQHGWSKQPWTAANAAVNVVLHPARLQKPRAYKRPSLVFVNSMSDLFHEHIPDTFVAQVFAVMEAHYLHTFQVLTKRPARAAGWPGPWPANVWQGVSVATQADVDRDLPLLLPCRAAVLFVSAEPLLEPLDLTPYLRCIGWVIVGGESGPNFRPMRAEWARAIRDQCVTASVPFFYKQAAALKPGTQPWLVEADGSRRRWEQHPTAGTGDGEP